MKDQRVVWWAGAILVAGVILVAGWIGFLSPTLDEVSRTHDQAESIESTNAGHGVRAEQLAVDEQRLGELQAELTELRRQFPTSMELRSFTQRLADLSVRSGAVVQSVTRAEPQAVVDSSRTEEVTDEDAGSGDQLFQVGITLVVEGGLEQQLLYVAELQAIDDRLFLVTGLEGVGTEHATITGTTFVFLSPSEQASGPQADATGAEAGP